MMNVHALVFPNKSSFSNTYSDHFIFLVSIFLEIFHFGFQGRQFRFLIIHLILSWKKKSINAEFTLHIKIISRVYN